MGCKPSKLPATTKPAVTKPDFTKPIPKPVTNKVPEVSKDPKLSTFENNILRFHNEAREENGLALLKYDKKLAQLAEDWGKFLKENEECRIRHPIQTQSERNKYVPGTIGQNLYVAHGYPNDPSSGLDAVQRWYSECNIYKKPLEGAELPDNFMEVGHFTQMMWEDAKKVGCARIDCPKRQRTNLGNTVEAKGSIVVCNYDKGNVGGQFQTKVPWPVKCTEKNLWIGE